MNSLPFPPQEPPEVETMKKTTPLADMSGNTRRYPDTQLVIPDNVLPMLRELEKKVMWLSAWMIHGANHLRPGRDGL